MSQQTDDLRDRVRDRYAAAATAVTNGPSATCCGVSADGGMPEMEIGEGFGAELYAEEDRESLPAAAIAASLGCGNPLAVAELHEGETVLDLGSGGGIDVLLSARRVGPTGKAYGVDMTDEMLALARANADKAGTSNVEFVNNCPPTFDGAARDARCGSGGEVRDVERVRASPRADPDRRLASTIFVPLTATLLAQLGWRHTYLTLAAVLGLITIPAHLWGLRGRWPEPDPAETVGPVEHAPDTVARSRAFLLLIAAVALGAFTGLRGRGQPGAAADRPRGAAHRGRDARRCRPRRVHPAAGHGDQRPRAPPTTAASTNCCPPPPCWPPHSHRGPAPPSPRPSAAIPPCSASSPVSARSPRSSPSARCPYGSDSRLDGDQLAQQSLTQWLLSEIASWCGGPPCTRPSVIRGGWRSSMRSCSARPPRPSCSGFWRCRRTCSLTTFVSWSTSAWSPGTAPRPTDAALTSRSFRERSTFCVR